MKKDSRIYVAGHRGLVGSAILRLLQEKGYTNIITRTSRELDLRNQMKTRMFFQEERPEYVFICAAKVGGVLANDTLRADFINDNLLIQTNLIDCGYIYKVKKLLFFGSNCLYPRYVKQPISEERLMAGKLEPTTESYAVAKIAGIKMCEAYRDQHGCNFISAIPVNLYGPNDNYDPVTSHVMPALIRKFHEAKINHHEEVVVWGSGRARREFLHVDDLASASEYLMLNYNGRSPVNIGTGQDIAIKDLALLIGEITRYEGVITMDMAKPEGIISKLLDVSKLHKLGWRHSIELKQGIESVYREKFLS